VNKKRQLLMVVDGGQVRLVLNTSTGSGRTFTHPDGREDLAVTPSGHFTVSRQVDGWRKSDLGELWRPKYFNGGIAVHGFTSVPAFPASHGCVRVSLSAMNMLWADGLIPIGTSVWVY
jgi:lipoprotein-anchoring transpeptidase ErfK/SrfK